MLMLKCCATGPGSPAVFAAIKRLRSPLPNSGSTPAHRHCGRRKEIPEAVLFPDGLHPTRLAIVQVSRTVPSIALPGTVEAGRQPIEVP